MHSLITLWSVVCSMIMVSKFWYPIFGCFGYKILQSRIFAHNLPQSILVLFFMTCVELINRC
jgi:hypothetical protein